jgi:hypothetical protein
MGLCVNMTTESRFPCLHLHPRIPSPFMIHILMNVCMRHKRQTNNWNPPRAPNTKLGPTQHGRWKRADEARAAYRLRNRRQTKSEREGSRPHPLIRSLLSQMEPAEELAITGTAALALVNTHTSRDDPVTIIILFPSQPGTPNSMSPS